jgi:hypothetical protein
VPYSSESHRRKIADLVKQGKVSPAAKLALDKASEGMSLPQRAEKASPPRTPFARDVAKRRAFFSGKP